jgi:hypothetical protein
MTVTALKTAASDRLDGPLAPGDLEHYARTGWLTARGFFSPKQAQEISDWTDALMARPEVSGAHMVYYEPSLLDPDQKVVQRVENFCPFDVDFDALVRGGPLAAAMAQLLDGPAVLFKDKINFKMPGGAGFEPHQDQQAGWSTYADMFVTALVCLDPATIENGCLEMADCPRQAGMIGQEWAPLTPEQMASFTLQPIETVPGDVLFFDSYVPHASKPNVTREKRRLLYLTYNAQRDGDFRTQYFADKRANFPPEIERVAGQTYTFRV